MVKLIQVGGMKIGRGRLKKKKKMVGEVVKRDMSIMEVARSLTLNRIEWWKRSRVADSV